MKFRQKKYRFKSPEWATDELMIKVNSHDIYYDYSDDSTFFNNGSEERSEILKDIRELMKVDYSDSKKLLESIFKGGQHD